MNFAALLEKFKPRYYYIDPKTGHIEQTDEILIWAKNFEGTQRVVAKTWIGSARRYPEIRKPAEVVKLGDHEMTMPDLPSVGGTEISTIFLGLDHRLLSGPPMLFETMIFSCAIASLDQDYRTRCSTVQQALAMHAVAERHAIREHIKRKKFLPAIKRDTDWPDDK